MRIVVTGMGVISPIGIGVDSFWTAAVNGVNGVRRIKSFDASSQRSKIAGEIPDFEPAAYLPVKTIEQTDRYSQLALSAAALAIEDAGGLAAYDASRLAVSLGTGMGGYATYEASAARYFRNQSTPPFTVLKTMANAAGAWIAIQKKKRITISARPCLHFWHVDQGG